MSSYCYGGSVVLKPEIEKENIDSMYEEGYPFMYIRSGSAAAFIVNTIHPIIYYKSSVIKFETTSITPTMSTKNRMWSVSTTRYSTNDG